MRMGPKARRFLELMMMVGGDALEGIASPHRMIREAAGFSAVRSMDRAARLVEENGWVSKRVGNESAEDWVFDLTEDGVENLMDGIVPEEAWSASWDGCWRTLSFDLPQAARAQRRQLDAWLAKRRFGHLQGSLWISHRPYTEWSAELAERKVDPRLLIFQESRALGQLSDKDYVDTAWNFKKINGLYSEYIQFLNTNSRTITDSDSFIAWQEKETIMWRMAFAKDPFLPESLLPSNYLGKQAWQRRKETFIGLVKSLCDA